MIAVPFPSHWSRPINRSRSIYSFSSTICSRSPLAPALPLCRTILPHCLLVKACDGSTPGTRRGSLYQESFCVRPLPNSTLSDQCSYRIFSFAHAKEKIQTLSLSLRDAVLEHAMYVYHRYKTYVCFNVDRNCMHSHNDASADVTTTPDSDYSSDAS